MRALWRLDILDTPPEERFDRLVRLTASMLGVPIAAISLVDADRQWHKAGVGLDVAEVPRRHSFCSHAIADATADTMVVTDALADDRFARNPFVVGDPGIRFYAGHVVRSPDGLAVGTLCALDHAPRDLAPHHREALADIAALVEQELARVNEIVLVQQLRESEQLQRATLDALTEAVILFGRDGIVRRTNPAAEQILGETIDDLIIRLASGRWRLLDDRGGALRIRTGPLQRALAGQPVSGEVVGWERPDGSCVLLRLSCVPDADGCGGVLVTFTDVTDEHRALQDVARFQHLFDHSNDIITLVDVDGQVQYASPSSKRVLGYPDGWHHESGIIGLIHPEDAVAAIAELDRLIRGDRGPEPFMVRIRAHDGTWRHVETVGTNLLHEPAVRGIVLTSRDATDRVLLTEQLAHLAHHDPLTDLANRSVLEPSLHRSLRDATQGGARVGLCFIDLDDFKQVNDCYGHAAGDAVIVEVADRIRSVVRSGDTAVRIGGDEFVVILDPVRGAADAEGAARRLRDAICLPPIVVGAHEVAASIGVAVSEPGESPASLLLRADALLYRAKAERHSTIALAPA